MLMGYNTGQLTRYQMATPFETGEDRRRKRARSLRDDERKRPNPEDLPPSSPEFQADLIDEKKLPPG